jgi:hypothetical protein
VFGSDYSNVTSYSVAADGSLSRVNNLAGTYGPIVVIDPTGHTLYALQFYVGGTGNSAYAFLNIGANGALTTIGSISTGVDTFPLFFTPGSSFAYQPFCYHFDQFIAGFVRHSDSTLTQFDPKAVLPPGDFGSGFCPQHIAISPDGKTLATTFNGVGSTTAASLGIYAINADGTLSVAAGSPYPAAAPGNDIAFDASGKYLVVSGANGISVYQFTAGATPILMSGSPVGGAAMDPLMFNRTGNLLFAASAATQNLYIFAFNAGVLTAAPGSPHSLGFTPGSLAVVQK